MSILVVVPTYNERENIAPFLDAVLAAVPQVHILVVDDSSPDGTASVVQERQAKDERVHLLLREKKEGLGRAYIAGFHWGLDHGYSVITEMDADFSHRPQDLKTLVERRDEADFLIGSRWVAGGATANWGLGRKIISRGGSFYARRILGFALKDWTGGFNMWTRAVLENIDLDTIQSNGYSFQIELKYRACRAGFKPLEIPIVFEDRRVGQSKMSLAIVLEAFIRVWKFRFQPCLRKESRQAIS